MSFGGFIKLHRNIVEDEFYFSERFTKMQALIDLQILATYKPRTLFIKGKEINLKPGELCYSIKSLADRWKWNERTVTKFLSVLEKRQRIQCKKNNVTTIITILNWETSQSDTYQNTVQNTLQSSVQNTLQNESQNKVHNADKQEYNNNINNNKNKKNKKDNKSRESDPFFINLIPEKLKKLANFIDLWIDWVIHFNSFKKRMVDITAKAQLSLLENHPDPIGVLEQALQNGWRCLHFTD